MSRKKKDKEELGRVLCNVCGELFTKRRRWQIFCSNKCRTGNWRVGHMLLDTKEILELDSVASLLKYQDRLKARIKETQEMLT